MKPKPRNPDAWWQDAYKNNEDVYAQFELKFGEDTIKPGSRIKIKGRRGVFIFRCLANNIKTGHEWIDALDESTKEWRSFYVNDIKGLVKMRSRRRKVNG